MTRGLRCAQALRLERPQKPSARKRGPRGNVSAKTVALREALSNPIPQQEGEGKGGVSPPLLPSTRSPDQTRLTIVEGNRLGGPKLPKGGRAPKDTPSGETHPERTSEQMVPLGQVQAMISAALASVLSQDGRITPKGVKQNTMKGTRDQNAGRAPEAEVIVPKKAYRNGGVSSFGSLP